MRDASEGLGELAGQAYATRHLYGHGDKAVELPPLITMLCPVSMPAYADIDYMAEVRAKASALAALLKSMEHTMLVPPSS